MDLRQLRYFVTVAQAGHMTRAAAQLGIQQPPLSQQIKALEQQLGVRLLKRHPKGVSPTEAGLQFLAEAQRLLNDFSDMRERMALLAKGEQGVLSLGFTQSAAAHAFTPAVLRACRRRYPGIVLKLGEDSAAGLTDAVTRSRMHAALLRVPVSNPEGLVFETLLTEPTLVAMPLDHRLAKVARARTTPVTLRALEGETLILVRQAGAPGLYANLLAQCARLGVEVRIAAEVERMMTNLNLVAAGVGLSVVPASMRGVHAKSVVYRPLAKSAGLDAPLTLVYRDADLSGATQSFLNLARQIAGEHAAA